MKHLISMRDLSKNDILHFIETAELIEKGKMKPNLKGKLAALLFFEPSTRTRFSFESAMKRLGGETLTMSGTGTTSAKKGESFADTIKTISQYADILVIRSVLEGASRYASEIVSIPVVNAGDGANQHPTQALLDLYSIVKTQGTLENITIAIIGDLKFGRTVHSLVYGLSYFSPRFYFISPLHLSLPEHIKNELHSKNIIFEEGREIDNLVNKLDIMYVTRIQKERFADPEEYEKLKGSYQITSNILNNVKGNFKILHPLPRVNEITTEVDNTPYAYYFEQAKNGLYMRQSIISMLLLT
ncbi:MAG: aspartate carbamoyltransferase [Candidatus Cloacimonadota bacterium]|nr:MAG: aspartate carbamoyltransferase [Candidatus Cloacimonadota bacterium]